MTVSHENYREVLNRPDMIEYRTKFGIAGIERQNFLKDSVKSIVENIVPKPYQAIFYWSANPLSLDKDKYNEFLRLG